MADKMEMADKKGDSATIFKIVKIMSGLLTSSAQASPSTDKDGNLILDHDKLARTWKEFLSGKFAAGGIEPPDNSKKELSMHQHRDQIVMPMGVVVF